MPEGSSVRSPGSWQGGSWVSALLVDVFCWTPSRDLALLSFCLLSCCFCARSANSEALDAIAFWSRHAMFPFAFCFWLVLFGVWVVGVCFLLCLCWFFVLELAPLCSDFAPLLNPQRGIQWMHLRNSFISTTRCDDLARATEAQDGKKKVGTGDCGRDPPTSPWDHPSGLPGPGCYWCFPPSIVPRVLLGCHAFVWRVGGSLLSLLRFHCGTKGIALCGVLLPSTPLWNVFALLCAAALRYSSLMFQVPLWTSIKALEYPIWSLGARSPSVRCCLPAPCLPSLCVVFLCPCVVLPPLLCPLSSSIDVPVLPGHVRAFSGPLCLWSVVLRFVTLCRCSGPLPPGWIRFFFIWRYSVTLVLGGFLPSLSFCSCCSGLGGLSVLGCVLVGPLFLGCFVGAW